MPAPTGAGILASPVNTELKVTDAIDKLRRYRDLAPFGIQELTALSCTILDAARIKPISSVARQLPNERAVRYYVSRGLVSRPEGKGPAATYGYRQLLQVLLIKIRQREGLTLEQISREKESYTGDFVERRVANGLGDEIPDPEALLKVLTGTSTPTSKTRPRQQPSDRARRWTRLRVEDGVELHLAEGHPLLANQADRQATVDLLRERLAHIVGPNGEVGSLPEGSGHRTTPPPPDPQES